MTAPTCRARLGPWRLWAGRRTPPWPGAPRAPYGKAYQYVNWGYLHPVPSIFVLLLGPVWLGVTRG